MIEAFLCAALALPPMPNTYKLLYGFIKTYKPDVEIVLVNKGEHLIGNGTATPVIYKNLRVWIQRRSS